MHDDTQRAPAAFACVTGDGSFAFQYFLRLTPMGMHSFHIKLLNIDTNHCARRNAARACGDCFCHRESIH
jgi:hypothetical protein